MTVEKLQGKEKEKKAAAKRRTPKNEKKKRKRKRRQNAALQSPKEIAVENLRLRLIERLCRLPEMHLADVEALFVRLEQDFVAPSVPLLQGSPGIPSQKASSGPTVLPAHKDWPHAPVHRLSEHGTFIVTGSTIHKNHFFRGKERLTLLQNKMLHLANEHQIILEAWAIFSNHYHFIAHTTGEENQLASFITRLHLDTAEEINRQDNSPGRQVWFNFWDTQLTFEKSYFARLNYVHQNAIKHGLVRQAHDYPWCSAGWFERSATPAQVKTIYTFKIDRLRIDDDYEPIL